MIVEPHVEAWLHDEAPPPHPVLVEMEHEGTARDFPIIGPLVGRLCALLARAVGARRVFEMGSGFGYSTAWFADAVGPEGRVVHTDGDPDLSREARDWLGRMGVADRVDFRVGDALDLVAAEPGPFDVVFIDVDKDAYPRAWDLACERVRVGGLVVTDNTLWSGRVADPAQTDDWTEAVREYLRRAQGDGRFVTSVLPLRDGVAVSLRTA